MLVSNENASNHADADFSLYSHQLAIVSKAIGEIERLNKKSGKAEVQRQSDRSIALFFVVLRELETRGEKFNCRKELAFMSRDYKGRRERERDRD